MRTIDKTLAAFKFSVLQDFRNIVVTLEQDGYNVADAMKYIIRRAKVIIDEAAYKECKECGMKMTLYSVNDKPGNMVGGGYKTQWLCRGCEYTIFSKNSLDEELKKAMRLRKLKLEKFEEERGV